MGFPYTLIKKDSPEAFDLGKGFWDKVFDRKYGSYIPAIGQTGSNFEETFQINLNTLIDKIGKYAPRWANDPALTQTVANRISTWAGSADLYLINYWEELEYFQKRKWRKKAAEEFTDLNNKLVKHLYYYKITRTIWDD